jgi:type II secretory pathway component PulF
VVPRFEKSCRDYDMTLPELAITVLRVGHLFSGYRYLAAPALCCLVGVDAVVLVLLQNVMEWRKLAWVWFVLSCLVPFLAIAWQASGLLVAYLKLLERLSRQ